MENKEKQLFRNLCSFKSKNFDRELLEYATPEVLGQLFFNRMQGVAYGTLRDNYMRGKVNREFYNSLKVAYDLNLKKNESYFKCVKMVSEILSECNCNVAMLKGAFLCAHYPYGYRTSNDIDILAKPQDVSIVGEKLLEHGFKQGNIVNGQFFPATRLDIIKSKMTRGETMPYIKEVFLPDMNYLEVDINFSLDYKNGDSEILSDILDRRCIVHKKGIDIPTLEKYDFFIHLCAHLYKEATTLPWIEMKRDMSLYKYCDIYMLLSEMTNDEVQEMFERAKEIGMEKICAFAIISTFNLFNCENEKAGAFASKVLESSPEFLSEVTAPKAIKKLKYQTADISARFFMNDRISDLKEVD